MIHTCEPWSIDKYGSLYTPSGQLLLGGVVTPMTAGVNRDTANANARRIVACVNACAGIPNGNLEAGGVLDTVIKERDELLAICRNVVERGIGASDIRAMEEAIAKAEAK